MLLSAVSVLVVAQPIFEIQEGLMNNSVYLAHYTAPHPVIQQSSQSPTFVCFGREVALYNWKYVCQATTLLVPVSARSKA